MTVYADVNGQAVTRMRLVVGATGPWFADCVLDNGSALSGQVTLRAGGLVLSGTVLPDQSGVYVSERTTRIVGGGGGWAKLLSAKAYHNDGGVTALNVAQDAARDAGEVLGAFAPEKARVGLDYVRQAGPASRVIEDAIGSAAWWVDYAGLTQVGARPASTPAESAYDVTAYEPRSKMVTLAADDLTVIGVGGVLTKTLDGPQTVRDLEIVLTAGDVVIKAWCGPQLEQSRLLALFQALVRRAVDDKLYGVYQYRVIGMKADRVELQSARKGSGMPDLSPISMWPGVAGVHAELTPGAEVLVQFIEGDRTRPIVTHFAGKDGVGFEPVSLSLGGVTGAAPVSLSTKADTALTRLQVAFDSHTHSVSGAVTLIPTAVPDVIPVGDLASTAAAKVSAV